MKLLALDTTSAVATAAVFLDDVCLLEREADSTKKHAETALPLIDSLLEEANVSINEIDCFAVDIGPGSFTGVRIGVSLVNAMAFALNKPVIPVDSLLALYEAADERELPVACILDARNGNGYAALYRAGETLAAPSAVEIESFLASLPHDAVIIGDAGEQKAFPRAKAVGFAALKLVQTARISVEPLYLRSSQAERLHAARKKENPL
jgi:tRNA threonylcarbamoyl adenosine modification protein YeaZ